MYICNHFDVMELVPKAVFDRFGMDSWMFLNPIALQALDGVRDFFGAPVTVNTWVFGGDLHFRGFRPSDSNVGALLSQHRLGNAFDCDVEGLSAEQARTKIMENKDDPRLALINCVEAKVSWLHFDCRNIPDRIRVVYP